MMVYDSKKLFSSVPALVLALHVCASSPVLAMDENATASSSVSHSSPSSSSLSTDSLSSSSSSSAPQSRTSQVQQPPLAQPTMFARGARFREAMAAARHLTRPIDQQQPLQVVVQQQQQPQQALLVSSSSSSANSNASSSQEDLRGGAESFFADSSSSSSVNPTARVFIKEDGEEIDYEAVFVKENKDRALRREIELLCDTMLKMSTEATSQIKQSLSRMKQGGERQLMEKPKFSALKTSLKNYILMQDRVEGIIIKALEAESELNT